MVLMGVSIYNQHALAQHIKISDCRSASLSAPGVKASTPASASALRESVYRFRVSTCYAYESLVLALCIRRALEEEQPCCRPSTSQMLTIHKSRQSGVPRHVYGLAIFTNPIHPIRMDCSLFSTQPLT